MTMIRSAEISDCGKFRYELRRVWDKNKPLVLFVGLNPSTADGQEDDNTSKKCIAYAKSWGYGGLVMANLFALRSTDPAALWTADDPVGPKNDAWLKKLIGSASKVVCAWGSAGVYRNRDAAVLKLVPKPYCLVRLKSGHPGHPLYKRADLRPVLLEV